MSVQNHHDKDDAPKEAGQSTSKSKRYVSETTYEDGTTERVRFTKTREVHDFDGPNGKASVWKKR